MSADRPKPPPTPPHHPGRPILEPGWGPDWLIVVVFVLAAVVIALRIFGDRP